MTRRAIACEDFGAPCDLLRRKARVLGGGRRAAQQSGGKKTYACRESGHGEILLDSPGRGHAWSFPPPCGEGRPKRSEGQVGVFERQLNMSQIYEMSTPTRPLLRTQPMRSI